MPRLIILILPLSILWVVMNSGPVGEPKSVAAVIEKNPKKSQGTGEFRTEGRDSSGKPKNIQGFDVDVSPLLPVNGREEGGKAWIQDLIGKEKATLVWEAVQDRIPVGFPKDEEVQLRAYIDEMVESKEERRWMCWAPGVSRGKALVYHEVENLVGLNPNRVGILANQFLGSGRWGASASHNDLASDQGKPAVLTWSVVPDGTMAPGTSGQSAAASDLQEFLNGIYGENPGQAISEQPWFSVLESAFENMGETSGVRFVYEPNDDGIAISTFNDGVLGTRGDIRLAARALDGPNNTLAFAYSPGYGDFVIDSSDTFFNSTGASSIRLHNVVTHELGHALGLAHVCPVNGTKLLEPLINLGFRGPRFDEFQSLQRQYGDPLEHHSEERDNDNTADATPLNLLVDDTLSFSRLSIDDNSDIDYFRIPALAGQKITVDIEPSLGAYLEGAQVGENCTGGVEFDPGNIHDLTLEIFAEAGGALLASSTSGGLGEGESIVSFEIPEDGNYYLRVDGDNSNAAQLYSLDIYTEDRPPRPEISLVGSAIVAESGKVKNFRPDPDETLKVIVELENIGNLATQNLQVSLTGPPNLMLFEEALDSPIIAPNGIGTVELIFGLRGLCGTEIPLTLTVGDPGMAPQEFDLNYALGIVQSEELMNEGFDASTSFPSGWTEASTGAGASWGVLPSVNTTSAPNAMFCQGVDEVAQSILTSSEVTLGGEGGVLVFRHLYDTESTWDGCVLEASLNGGAWFDLPGSDAVVISGGYNETMRLNSAPDISLRNAWTGSGGEFLTTEIELPSAWAGDDIRFRWIIACDGSVPSIGWYLDDVQITTSTAICEVHEPELVLESGENSVFEGELVEVTVSSVLPLVLEKAVSFSVSGEAVEGDLGGALIGSIAAGADMVTLSLLAIQDGLVEGDESLLLTLAGEGMSESFTLQDPSGYTAWASSYSISADHPELDIDDDGFSALAEYLLDTDPTSAGSNPAMMIQLGENVLLFPLGELPIRPDATIGAEVSSDLLAWNPVPLTRTSSGLEIPRSGEKSFVRLTFSLNE